MIKNLERFCNEIAQDKLLWTTEVLIFFGITKDATIYEFEAEREVREKQVFNQI